LLRALWWTVLPECGFTLGVDEGMYIHGAQRILRGELPNREFFSFLGPVSYAILALVGLLRGTVLAADARMVAVACSLTGAFAYAHLVSGGRGLARWPLYALSFALAIEFETGPGSYFTFSHHAVSMFFAAIALLACAPSLREDRELSGREIRACGLATSLTLMTTTNLGAYLTLAFTSWLAIDGWLNGQRRRLAYALVRYWLWVASLPTVYVVFHLAIRNGGRLYRELVEFLFVNYASVNAANLDYLFFFRMRLQDAFRQYLEDASLPGLLASIGGNIVLFMGHVPVLVLGVWALVTVSRSSGAERAFCRTALLLTLFYVASLSTTLTNPFVSNISTHARPAFVLLMGWLLLRPRSSASPEHPRRHRFAEALVAVLLVAWAAQLPDWRNAHLPTASTRVGVLSYGSERQYSDEEQVLSLLRSRLRGGGLVAYHYYAPRWYAYFPEAQRLRSYVLVPFLSPTSHYQEALMAMQQGTIRYAIEDRSFELNPWDPRIRVTTLEETNGAAFYQFIRIHGKKVLSNDTYTVWKLPVRTP
jgi:hypothetical protein